MTRGLRGVEDVSPGDTRTVVHTSGCPEWHSSGSEVEACDLLLNLPQWPGDRITALRLWDEQRFQELWSPNGAAGSAKAEGSDCSRWSVGVGLEPELAPFVSLVSGEMGWTGLPDHPQEVCLGGPRCHLAEGGCGGTP